MALWQFSESSLPLLRRCIEASKLNPNYEWIEKFGTFNYQDENIVKEDNDIKVIPTPVSQLGSPEQMIQDEVDDESDDIWREIKNTDPISQFDYLVEKCLKHPALYPMLAEKLTLTTVEKLCNHIFESEIINFTFLEKIYNSFLPVYLKREFTRTTLDLIIKAEKYNNTLFKYLLEIIIKDIELPGQVFQQYILTLENKFHSELLKNVILFNLSKEVFVHHLYSIHFLYKNCEKTDDIQKYILSNLTSSSQECVNDKNYGRLLLTYLQAQKKFTTNYSIIQKVIDLHRSPFKKPCMNMFHELQKLQVTVPDSNDNY